jgi:hypothetical protein
MPNLYISFYISIILSIAQNMQAQTEILATKQKAIEKNTKSKYQL